MIYFKKILRIFLVFTMLSAQLTASFAQTVNVCSQGAILYYLNGVNKPIPSQVAVDSRILGREVSLKNMSGYKETSYLYNPSDTIVMDVLWELASQMTARRNASIVDTFVQAGLSAWGMVTDMTDAEKEQVRNKIATAVLQYNLSTTFTVNGSSTTTAELVKSFENTVAGQLRNGNKVIIVSHSQGNMFANDVYTAINADLNQDISRGLAVVNVGNAAAKASSGLYVTGTQDLVINVAARALAATIGAQQPMAANFDAAGAWSIDSTGHGFTEIYLSHALPSGTSDANSLASKTLSLIQQAINVAIDPKKLTSDGPITATLTWANYGDVDLHIYEPGGSHVWYKNAIGTMGKLDLDNTRGFGPEHYFTSCSQELAVGHYIFAANYYQSTFGVGPQQATIEIKTLKGTQKSIITLPLAQGDSGLPTKMFDVEVTKSQTGSYSFATTQL